MPAQQLPLALDLVSHFDRHDLVVSQANKQAFTLLQNWPNWHAPITVLIGAAGCGKSHMASLWLEMSGARSCKPHDLDAALAYLGTKQPLLIEDIGPNEFSQTALFHLFNTVTQARLENPTASMLLTSRYHPHDWGISLADLASRLKTVQLVEISPPDDGVLMAVLTKLFADRQLVVEPHLIHYCLSRMERSFEAAVRFVTVVDRLALEKKSKITRPLALQALTLL